MLRYIFILLVVSIAGCDTNTVEPIAKPHATDAHAFMKYWLDNHLPPDSMFWDAGHFTPGAYKLKVDTPPSEKK